MANDSYTQQALAADNSFKERVKAQLINIAFIVLAEGPPNPTRVRYANQILNGLEREVNRITPILVMRTNLMAFNTSYEFSTKRVVTAAGDADILSQLNSDFNTFAGPA